MKRWMVKSRRIFALLMAVMIIPFFDVTDVRANVTLPTAQVDDTESDGLVASGSCGDSATWEFYSDGKLQITGTGEMSFESAPWKDYRKRITSVVIADGITTLGTADCDGAFEDCSNLTDVEIPDSVTGLGNYTFSGCTSLTSINIPAGVTATGDHTFGSCRSLTSIEIPAGVTDIGDYAFVGCASLTSIEIPDSVTNIGGYAFYMCSSLTGIKIPAGVTNIGDLTGKGNAFADCSSLESIEVAEGNSKYDSRENCNAIIETSSNELKTGCKNTKIPNGVTSIGESAFWRCTSLTDIEIPDSVTAIGLQAFSECTSLTGVYIPKSMKSIDTSAFADCSSLERVEVAEENTVYDSRENCNAIIETSSNSLITGCKNTKIPDSVTTIERLAFNGCSSLTSLEIPAGVTSIGNFAFYGCTSLKSINIPAGVTSIGNQVFNGCSSLKSINIPAGVTSIGNQAFKNCSSLTSIEIPNSVTSIGSHVFSGCSGLEKIEVAEGNSKYDSRENCNGIIETSSNTLITGCKNTIIPASVTGIGKSAFAYNSGLTSLEIPAGVTSIEAGSFGAFVGCSGLERIEVAEGNTVYDSRENCNAIIETSSNKLLAGCKATVIPDSVTDIGESAFYYCSGLSGIEIPAGVTTIGNYAFSGCSSLTDIEIPASVTSISDTAFYDLTSLTIWGLPGSYAEDYAGIEGIPFKTIRYDVQFVSDGQIIETQSVEYGKDATPPANVVKEGYTFSSWDKDFTEIKADTTVNAVWTINQYQVTFKDGDTVLDTQSVEYGKAAAAPAVAPKEGYTFSWDKDFTEIKADTTVNAVWTINKYQVTFQDGDTVLDTQEVEYGKAAAAPTVAPKEGYTLSWDKDFAEIKADTTVNAVWTINKYQVTFQDSDTVLDTQEVEYGKAAAAPTVAPREGYTFRWDKDFTEIKEDTTVNAVWTANEVKKYQVIFKDGDKVLDTQEVEYGKAAAAPQLSKTGYKLDWDKDFTNIKENITVNAKWSAEQYTVQFNKNRGLKVSKSSIKVTYNGKYGTLPTAVRKKYIFLGWYTAKSGGNKITSSTKVSAAKNHTLYARWTKVKTRKVSIKKVKARKKKMTVTFGKVSGAKGYEVKYSANKKFKSARKVKVTSTKAVIKKLKSKRTIYVKVRAYKMDSAGSKVYGAFSSVKRVKIK